MGLGIPNEGDYTLIKDGYWDYLFESGGKTDVGFDLADTPFGEAEFDAVPYDSIQNVRFEDMFTGLIFYRPVQEHRLITGWAGFTTEDFASELKRRIAVFSEAQGMDLSEDDINDFLYRNNEEEESRYRNLEQMRQMIDKWSVTETEQ
ncbi:MAG: hypothetical protein LBU80_03655 [Rikenellaceae bacterium]|jgi:hypothetical protein|nr:hypothetical protein [Rikenellaceae bacterium]